MNLRRCGFRWKRSGLAIAAVIDPFPRPAGTLPNRREIAVMHPVGAPPGAGVHRDPPVAGDEALGRCPAYHPGRILAVLEELLHPYGLRSEHHRVLVCLFAEHSPLPDA